MLTMEEATPKLTLCRVLFTPWPSVTARFHSGDVNHVTPFLDPGLGSSYRMNLTVGKHSARHLRRILRMFLEDWDMVELSDAGTLALTELVANVVRHVPDRRCTVLILRLPTGLRVEVTDASPWLPRQTPGDDELAEGGRGLLLVDAVTDRWDVALLPGGAGKTVWFECDHGLRGVYVAPPPD